MDWNKGYSAAYYATLVDPVSWRDIERFEITGGTIKQSNSGLRVSADINTRNFNLSGERWIRIWAEVRQNDSSERVALFTGLATAPKDHIDGTRVNRSLECYSSLKPAKDVLLERGWYAPAGFSGAKLVEDLLSVTPAPIVTAENSPSLSGYIISEEGESRLSMAEKILASINWRLRIGGDGSIQICPLSRETLKTFDPLNNDCIEPELNLSDDWYSCPNVFRATVGGTSAIARDDSENSPLSTVIRGREVWKEENNCDLSDGETLAEYALRRLKELQMHAVSLSYDRRYFPDIVPTDVIELHYPAQGINGKFYLVSQSIRLGTGLRTSEEVLKI